MLDCQEWTQKKLESETNLAVANLVMNNESVKLHESILQQSVIFVGPKKEKSYQNFLITAPETFFWYREGTMKIIDFKTDMLNPFIKEINIYDPSTIQLFKVNVEKIFEGLLRHLEFQQIRFNILEKHFNLNNNSKLTN